MEKNKVIVILLVKLWDLLVWFFESFIVYKVFVLGFGLVWFVVVIVVG